MFTQDLSREQEFVLLHFLGFLLCVQLLVHFLVALTGSLREDMGAFYQLA